MSIQSALTSISTPLKSNKRMFGLVTVVAIIIAVLGAIYYFHIQSNKQEFRQSQLSMLDFYFEKAERKINNDVLRFYSKGITNELRIDSLASAMDRLSNVLNMKEQFEEFLIVWEATDTSTEDTLRKGEDSFQGDIDLFFLDTLFDKLTVKSRVINSVQFAQNTYHLFARQYNINWDDRLSARHKSNIKIKITLIGLVSADDYKSATRKLNPWLITLLVTFLLLALVGMPFLKLIFITEDERLYDTDIVLAVACIVLGAPILVAGFLGMNNFFSEFVFEVPDRLESLTDSINTRFTKENNQLIRDLNAADLTLHDSISVINIGDSCGTPSLLDRGGVNVTIAENFKFITKIDEFGNVCDYIPYVQPPDLNVMPISLKHRSYYNDMVKGENLWKTDVGIEYVMRPVVSIESDEEEAVYIVRGQNDSSYKVGSVQLKSLHDPILPFGYQFAIIDEQGEVWFHSKKNRSTLENLYEVTGRDKSLKTAVDARISVSGVLSYRGESQRFFVSPIPNTNLSIVSMYDNDLLSVQVAEVLTIASVFLLIAIFLMGIVILLSVFLKTPKWGTFKYRIFLFDFLTPKEENRDIYAMLSTCLFALLVVLAFFSPQLSKTPSMALVTSLLITLWTYVIVYLSLHPDFTKRSFQFRLRHFFLLIFVIGFTILPFRLLNDLNYIKITITLVAASLAIVILSSLGIRLITGMGIAKTRLARACSRFASSIGLNFSGMYSFFLFNWLLLSSSFPMYVVYNTASTINDELWIKANQMQLTNAYFDKVKALEIKLPHEVNDTSDFDLLFASHIENGTYLDNGYSIETTQEAVIPPVTDNILRRLLWKTRPIYDEKIRRFKGLVFTRASDDSWSTATNTDSISFYQRFTDPDEMHVLSVYDAEKNESARDKHIAPSIIKWLGLASILGALYLLVMFYVDRFFGFRFRHLRPNDFDNEDNLEYVAMFAKILKTEDANSGLLLIGPPFSGKRTFAKKVVHAGKYKNAINYSFAKSGDLTENLPIDKILMALQTDGIEDKNNKNKNGPEKTGPVKEKLEKEKLEKADIFIVYALEYNLKSQVSNQIKLRTISHLITLGKKIILISECYPTEILDFYSQDSTDPNSGMSSEYFAWRDMLSAFPQLVIGIKDTSEAVEKGLEGLEGLKGLKGLEGFTPKNRSILKKELGYSNFLPSLASVIGSRSLYIDKSLRGSTVEVDEQRMVMHTQNLSHGYYTDIWNSLAKREKYLLYDLATDGFMNVKNGISLFSLMKKGLIVWHDRPTIFNRSFQNFILSNVSRNEALKFELERRVQGSWGTMRIVFYLILLATVVFIALGEPGLIGNFEAFLGAIAGLGALIPIASSFFSGGKGK